jgi:hypothetical protein
MKPLKKDIARWSRWLHIYLSMFSFAALLFFAFTGITLNHTEWIEGRQIVEQVQGSVNLTWVDTAKVKVDELQIVEHLRNSHAIRARLAGFITDESECAISFKGPGYNADGFVDRSNGSYALTITKSGIVALMNDLHKGRDTGSAWSWLIDLSAGLMIFVSLTGFMMIFFLKKKRLNGLMISLLGGIVIVVIYYAFVIS